jgi:ABC-type sugar transport system substrate-binding protein
MKTQIMGGRQVAHYAAAGAVFLAIGCTAVAGGIGQAGASTRAEQASGSAACTGKSASTIANYVKAAEKQPEKLLYAKPIGKKVPTGLTIDTITSGTPNDQVYIKFYKEAASALGWHLNVISTDGTAQQLQNAWAQILREKPAGVMIEPILPYSDYGTYVTQAKSEGIATSAATGSLYPGLIFIAPAAESDAVIGKADAYWVANNINTTGQANAGSVFLDVPEIPEFATEYNAYQSTLKQLCPGIHAGTLNISEANLQQAPTQVTSYLRANPNTKYVMYATDGFFVGMAQALKSANLHVNIVGDAPTSANVTDIQSGAQTESIANDYGQQALSLVDAIARHVVHVSVPKPSVYPAWIVTQKNINQYKGLSVVSNPINLYKKDWGKS